MAKIGNVNFDRGMQIPAQVGGPDLSPENMTVSDYSGEFDAKIAQLEQQIAKVKERIARNERALSSKSYEDVNNKLAALEMKKINSQDPSTIWRWQNQRQDTIKANSNVKTNAVEQFKNKVNMWKRMPPSKTTEGLEHQISNINSVILEGDNIGADVSELYEKMQYLQNRIPGGTASENTAAEVDTIIKTAKTSDEIASVLNTRTDLTPNQKSRLKVRLDELKKQEAAKAAAKAKADDQEAFEDEAGF